MHEYAKVERISLRFIARKIFKNNLKGYVDIDRDPLW